jgi:hypothetical protein
MRKLYSIILTSFLSIYNGYCQTEVNTYSSTKTNIVIDQVLPDNNYLARGIGSAGNYMFILDPALSITKGWTWTNAQTGANQDIHFSDDQIIYSADSRLIAFSSAGAYKWSYGGMNFGKIGQGSTGDLLVTGSVFDTRPNGVILRTDKTGAQKWLRGYRLENNDWYLVINDFIKLSDGNYLAAGRINHKNEDFTISMLGVLFKISEDGKVIWARNISSLAGNPGMSPIALKYVDFTQVIEGHDGKVIATGISNEFNKFSTIPAGYSAVVALDFDGNPVGGINTYENADGTVVKIDGGYIQYMNTTDSPKRGRLKFLDKNLNQIYQNDLYPTNNSHMTSISSVYQRPDKKLVIAGQYNTAVSTYTGWSLILSKEGLGSCKDRVQFPVGNKYPATTWSDSVVVLKDSVIADFPFLRNFTLNFNTSSISKNQTCSSASTPTQLLKLSNPIPFANNSTSYEPGNTVPVRWGSLNLSGNVKLDFSADSGKTWSTIAADIPVTQKAFNWYVPLTFTNGGKLRILSEESSTTGDTTLNLFRIVPTYYDLFVTSPAPNSVLYPGQTTSLTWTADQSVSTVTIEYSLDSGITWTSIATSIPASNARITTVNGKYDWNVPDVRSGGIIVRFTNGSWTEFSRVEYEIATPTSFAGNLETSEVVNLYPVPAKDLLMISGIGNEADIEIYSVTGQLMLQEKYNNGEAVKLNELNNGSYFVRINTQDKVVVKPFVKE